jgi:type IV pilus assembly protein PilM
MAVTTRSQNNMAKKAHFGLDIGLSTIKLVYLQKDKQDSHLIAYGMAPTPNGGMLSESDYDKQSLVEIIKRLCKETKVNTNYAVVSLPESQVFTRIIEIPPVSDKELASAIQFEAEQYIPRSLSEVSFKWQVISKGDKSKNQNTVVLLVAAPTNLVNKYIDITKKAGLKLLAMETDLLAQARALVGNNPFSPTTMIVSIGSSSTDLSIVKGGSIYFTRAISSGGNTLTKAIMSDFSLEESQAESYKTTYGLLEDQFEGKVFNSLKPSIELIISEIRRAMSFYQTKNPNDAVKRIVLSGGSAKLPGLLIYFANSLGTEVQIGDPWFNIKKDSNIINQLNEDASIYSVAVGLALKEV